MRCHKCGFVSFDYLSDCRKCGADLTGTRQDLNLLNVKPEIPSFLGSLLRDFSPEAGGTAVDLSMDDFDELGSEELELGEGLDLYPNASMPLGGGAAGAAATAQREESQPLDSRSAAVEDKSAIDLTDKDWERILNDSKGDEDFKLPLGEAPAARPSEIDSAALDSQADVAEKVDEDMVIELSERDLENILMELKEVPNGKTKTEED